MFRRQAGIVSLAAVSIFLLCGDTAPASCNQTQIGPSKGEVIGVGVAAVAVVAIGTVTLVHIHNSHHTIKGCVVAGPTGVEIRTSGEGPKTYKLAGDTNVKVGDLVKVHGDKVKKVKGSTDDETFTVEKLNKDYGPCKVTP
jgi:hypothetical protein